jgi:hypothetical protein
MVPPVGRSWYHRCVVASRRASGDRHELTPGAVAVVLAVFIGAAVVGLAAGGLIGAFVGALAGALASVTVLGLRRIRETDRSLDAATAPKLDGLDRRQVMTVMTAVMGASDAFRSELLDALEEARETASSDPARALEIVRALREDHPRSPAVHAELARLHLAASDEALAIEHATRAIGLALDGGMNPTAARLFEEFAPLRDRFALSSGQYGQLARVLRAGEADEAADWCDGRK